MKKEYIKPEMLVHQIAKRSILLSSTKGVYGKIGETEIDGLKYKGYITEEEEEEIDPD